MRIITLNKVIGGAMMDINRVLEDIKKINSCNSYEFASEISSAFKNFNIEGENRIIIDDQDDLTYGNNKVFTAFINHPDSPIIRVEVEKGRGEDENLTYYNIRGVYIV